MKGPKLLYLNFFAMKDIFDIQGRNIPHLEVTSRHFHSWDYIPSIFTCEGWNNFPAIKVTGIPSEVKTLALIVDDPDAPGKTFVHLVAWNIPILWNGAIIDENILVWSKIGINDFWTKKWGWPCPPKGHGIHHYCFKVYWLNTDLDIHQDATKEDVLNKIDINTNLVAYWELIWEYERGTL